MGDQPGVEQHGHAQRLRPLVQGVVRGVGVGLELLVGLQAHEAQIPETVDVVRHGAVEIDEAEGEEKAVVPFDGLQQFLLRGEADISQTADAGEIP